MRGRGPSGASSCRRTAFRIRRAPFDRLLPQQRSLPLLVPPHPHLIRRRGPQQDRRVFEGGNPAQRRRGRRRHGVLAARRQRAVPHLRRIVLAPRFRRPRLKTPAPAKGGRHSGASNRPAAKRRFASSRIALAAVLALFALVALVGHRRRGQRLPHLRWRVGGRGGRLRHDRGCSNVVSSFYDALPMAGRLSSPARRPATPLMWKASVYLDAQAEPLLEEARAGVGRRRAARWARRLPVNEAVSRAFAVLAERMEAARNGVSVDVALSFDEPGAVLLHR